MIDIFGYQGITDLEYLIARLTLEEIAVCDKWYHIEYRAHLSELYYLELLGCLDSELL